MLYTQEEALLYHRALRRWGTNLQYLILLEETAELQKEICKAYRQAGTPANLDKLAEEIADVLIMLGQLVIAFNLPVAVGHFKEQKLARLKERLEEHDSKHD